MHPRAAIAMSARTLALLFALFCAACGAKTGLFVPESDADADAGAMHSMDGGRDVTDASVPFDTFDETALAIEVSLNGLRWELPCESNVNDFVCTTPSERRVSATLSGPPGVEYRVTLRFRGVVETKQYDGGSNDGRYWQIGGTPQTDTVNIYGLTISSPPQQYYLNRRIMDALACFALDYQETITLDTGATVTLDALSEDDRELRNLDTSGNPIVVPGVRPAPAPFDGQFIQMDVVSLERVR